MPVVVNTTRQVHFATDTSRHSCRALRRTLRVRVAGSFGEYPSHTVAVEVGDLPPAVESVAVRLPGRSVPGTMPQNTVKSGRVSFENGMATSCP